MKFVMEKRCNGSEPERVLWSTNARWLKMAAQRRTADCGGKAVFTVRKVMEMEDLTSVPNLGRTVIVAPGGKTEN